VALVRDEREWCEGAVTRVTFRELDESEIDRYLASGEWEGRAGAYAVQGLGASLVERVDGDLSNVIGLPIPVLTRMMANLQNRE
jgi:septum formation protein